MLIIDNRDSCKKVELKALSIILIYKEHYEKNNIDYRTNRPPREI